MMDASTAHAVLLNLLEAARRVAKRGPQGGSAHAWQLLRPNLSLLVRRMRMLLPVLEELRDNSRVVLLLPSAVAAIQRLHSTVLRAAELVARVHSSGQLWLLAQLHALCDEFNDTTGGIATSLGLLPLDLLEELPVELKEQIELLRQQAERSSSSSSSKPHVDAAAADLHQQLLSLLGEFENKKSPNSDCIDQLFKALGLDSAMERRRELEQLQRHSQQQPQAASLINFLCYSSCILYGAVAEDELVELKVDEEGQQQEKELKKCCTISVSIPDEFKCPISLELMRDPVIIASGQTYERCSIQRWLDTDNTTCPKSGQKLSHTTLTPNFALRNLISQWCDRNNVELPPQQQQHNGDEPRGRRRGDYIMTSLEAAKITSSFLVDKLASGCSDIQRQAAYELRLLAKSGIENRRCIANAGAVPLLVKLLVSEDPRTQENAITALLNLSILDSNKPLIVSTGALDPIVDVVLCSGHTMEARENAAATIFSLSTFDEYKAAIGSKEAAIPQLLELVRSGSATGAKDAVSALFNLSMLDANRKKVVQAGAVELLVDILEQQLPPESDMIENALALLGLLASSEESASCVLARASAIPTLVRILESGEEREKENAASVLLALCKCGHQNAMRRMMDVPGCIAAIHNLLANGSSRGKRKATSVMRALQKWNPSPA